MFQGNGFQTVLDLASLLTLSITYTPSIAITVKHSAKLPAERGSVCQLHSMPSQATSCNSLPQTCKKQAYMHRTQYRQNQASPHHLRGTSEAHLKFYLPLSPEWRQGINDRPVFRWARWYFVFSCWNINDKILLFLQSTVQNHRIIESSRLGSAQVNH